MKVFCFLMGLISCDVWASGLFPELEDCSGIATSESCGLALMESGEIIDKRSKKKIYTLSVDVGILESASLYKTNRGYLLERQNHSSSKTRQWITFEYLNGNMIIDRFYGFTRWIGELTSPRWYGYECRGKSELSFVDGVVSLTEAAELVICGDTLSTAKVASMRQDIQGFQDVGLTINVPVINGLPGETASYIFLNADDPDILNMLCLSGCGDLVGPKKSHYFGAIGKQSNIKMSFSKTGSEAEGVYRYASSTENINLRGFINSSRMDLIEFGRSRDSVRANFIGKADGDGYRGKWISKNGDNKEHSYFIYPSPLY